MILLVVLCAAVVLAAVIVPGLLAGVWQRHDGPVWVCRDADGVHEGGPEWERYTPPPREDR